FSSKGTLDYDEDEIFLTWDFGDGNRSDKDTMHIFREEGIYQVTLTATDSRGNETSESMEIWAGNAQPDVSLKIEGNQTFFWDEVPINYAVEVNDKEDGIIKDSENNNQTNPWVSIDILEEGFDETQITLGHRAPLKTLEGKRLIDGSDCMACHKEKDKSIGPDYVSVATRYTNDPEAIPYLTGKIIKGGGGVWGDQAMAAHPQLEEMDVKKMVEYILSLSSEEPEGLPMDGEFTPDLKSMKETSKLIIRASYSDNGYGSIPSILVEQQKILKSPMLTSGSIFDGDNYESFEFEGNRFTILRKGGWFSFDRIDLNVIKEIMINATVGEGSKSRIVMFENDPDGNELGSAEFIASPGPGPREGSRFATASIQINTSYFGNIAFKIESNSEEDIIGAFTDMKFNR
ncbi:MAG: PKD domain-containing protein, partial [Saprospiraceae bacterium]|nr:PKD domain-containing protein [Saprospiraceae bacterium]